MPDHINHQARLIIAHAGCFITHTAVYAGYARRATRRAERLVPKLE
jgi:hypothetical protein